MTEKEYEEEVLRRIEEDLGRKLNPVEETIMRLSFREGIKQGDKK